MQDLWTHKLFRFLKNWKKHAIIQTKYNMSESQPEDKATKKEEVTENTEKRIGCSHYKRRAKFVVSILPFVKFEKNIPINLRRRLRFIHFQMYL